MLEELLKVYVRTLLESGELKEFSSAGGGMIQGYTLPLGMKPTIPTVSTSKKRKKKNRKK
jgi:hypothetical protein